MKLDGHKLEIRACIACAYHPHIDRRYILEGIKHQGGHVSKKYMQWIRVKYMQWIRVKYIQLEGNIFEL